MSGFITAATWPQTPRPCNVVAPTSRMPDQRPLGDLSGLAAWHGAHDTLGLFPGSTLLRCTHDGGVLHLAALASFADTPPGAYLARTATPLCARDGRSRDVVVGTLAELATDPRFCRRCAVVDYTPTFLLSDELDPLLDALRVATAARTVDVLVRLEAPTLAERAVLRYQAELLADVLSADHPLIRSASVALAAARAEPVDGLVLGLAGTSPWQEGPFGFAALVGALHRSAVGDFPRHPVTVILGDATIAEAVLAAPRHVGEAASGLWLTTEEAALAGDLWLASSPGSVHAELTAAAHTARAVHARR